MPNTTVPDPAVTEQDLPEESLPEESLPDESPDAPPGRWGAQGVRRSAEETKQRLLTTALRMLRATGLTVSLDHLNMEVLIREADVPRSSVFRLWGGKRSFFADLMLELVKPENGQSQAFDPETVTVARGVVEANRHRLGTAAGRTAVLHETIRQAVARNHAAVLATHTLKTHSALISTLPSLPEESREKVAAALSAAERQYMSGLAQLYESLLPALHLRMKAGLTYEDVVAAGSAIVQGLSEKAIIVPDIVNRAITRPGLDGEPVEWTLTALTYLGIVESMTESF